MRTNDDTAGRDEAPATRERHGDNRVNEDARDDERNGEEHGKGAQEGPT